MDMNGLGRSGYLQAIASGYQNTKGVAAKETRETKAEAAVSDLKDVSGRTIGSPKLSEKALKYYEKLKKKFSHMDFILVSPDMKAEAERNKGMYKSSKELLVLIDSDKIERMAEDEEYRKKYETILSGARAQMTQMKSSLGANASRISSFGMTFDNNGNASMFAVIDKSLALQRERIEAKREANIKERKAAQKKADKKRAEQKAESKREEAKKAGKKDAEAQKTDSPDKVTVTADSWEELLKKIDDVIMSEMTNSMRTESEIKLGQNIDFSL